MDVSGKLIIKVRGKGKHEESVDVFLVSRHTPTESGVKYRFLVLLKYVVCTIYAYLYGTND